MNPGTYATAGSTRRVHPGPVLASRLALAGSLVVGTTNSGTLEIYPVSAGTPPPLASWINRGHEPRTLQVDASIDHPCEAAFEDLANRNPDRLLALLRDGLEPADLTFAAEIAGRQLHGARLILMLRELLQHARPVVREGALYGLAHHMSQDNVLKEILRVASEDPNPAVRAVAADILAEAEPDSVGQVDSDYGQVSIQLHQ